MTRREQMEARKAAREALFAAEEVYLTTHGWTKLGEDEWLEPKTRHDYERKLRHGHAVNSQKAWGRFDHLVRNPDDE